MADNIPEHESMLAVRLHSYGDPEVMRLEKSSRPKPGSHEVLVRVQAVGVNPIDWKIRAGLMQEHIPHSFPLILGWDVSGLVELPGDQVTEFKPGDPVYGRLDTARNGAYAEFAVAQSKVLARRPKSLDAVAAAAVPLAGLTAWQALFEAGKLSRGQKVLIHAAAGGVGHFAVQFACWKGAQVLATASAANADFVKNLGADEVVDYQSIRFEDQLHGLDLVLDPMGGEIQERSLKTLKPGGLLVALLGVSAGEEAARLGVRIKGMSVRSDRMQLEQITQLIDEGKVKPAVSTVLGLAEAAKAHALIQTGKTRGKIVLKVSE